jgi:hypothetical protein
MSLLSGTLRELAGFTEALRVQARARRPTHPRPLTQPSAAAAAGPRAGGAGATPTRRAGRACTPAAGASTLSRGGRACSGARARRALFSLNPRLLPLCVHFVRAQTDSVLVDQLTALERGPLDEVKALRKCAPSLLHARRREHARATRVR